MITWHAFRLKTFPRLSWTQNLQGFFVQSGASCLQPLQSCSKLDLCSSLSSAKMSLNRQRSFTWTFHLVRTGWHISCRTWVGLGMFHHFAHLLSQFCLLFHQPRHNQAEGGTTKIKVIPTEVGQEMCHPVLDLCSAPKTKKISLVKFPLSLSCRPLSFSFFCLSCQLWKQKPEDGGPQRRGQRWESRFCNYPMLGWSYVR